MSTTENQRSASEALMDEYRVKVDSYWSKYAADVTPGEERALADQILAARAAYSPMQEKLN